MWEVGVEKVNGKASLKARREMQQKKWIKQIPVAALGSVTPYASATAC